MKLQQCERCGKQTAEGLTLCPECMKAAGAAAEEVTAAEELRDIARVLSITAGTDTNIRDAMTGILNIADRLDRRKKAWKLSDSFYQIFGYGWGPLS